MNKLPRKTQMDLVTDYSLGLLSAEQEKVLLATARANPELEAMLRAQCADFEGFGYKSRAAKAASKPPTLVTVTKPRHRQPKTWFLGSVAAVAVALVVWMTSSTKVPEYWIPVDDVMIAQRSHAVGGEELSRGIESYSARDMAAAIVALRSANVHGANKDLRDIYLASALINSGRPHEAHKILENMDLSALPAPWRTYGNDLLKLASAD